MSEPRNVHCFGFLEHPYDEVRALLLRDPLALLQRATATASIRAKSAVVSLKLDVAGVEVGVDVRPYVRRIVDESPEGESPKLQIELTWEAAHNPGILPSMMATLVVWPFSPTETQIEIDGSYWVPMGSVGRLFDAAVGHRIAQATVLRFRDDVLEQLLAELAPKRPLAERV